MKYLMIALRLIPTLAVTPFFLVNIIIFMLWVINNANRPLEIATSELLIAIWAWTFTGKYEGGR